MALRNALTSRAVSGGEVAPLSHKARNHAMEARAFKVKRDSLSAHALLPRAQRPEVLSGLGDNIIIQEKLDSANLREQTD